MHFETANGRMGDSSRRDPFGGDSEASKSPLHRFSHSPTRFFVPSPFLRLALWGLGFGVWDFYL